MKTLLLTLLFLTLSTIAFGQSQVEVISEQANLRGTPSQNGKVVSEVMFGETFQLIKQSGAWFLVQTNEYVGWLHGNTVKLVGSTKVSEPLPRAIRSSGASSDSSSTYDPPTGTSRRSSSYRTYIRGPRGGCYYINGSGNKTYVDRSMCN